MPRSRRQPTPAPKGRSQSRNPSTSHQQKRQATVYDAVAGRVSSTGFIPSAPRIPKTRDTPSSSTLPNPPDEVLFRRAGAPTRYAECDLYWQDRFLDPDTQKLPESDLLKGVHAYVSDFFGRAVKGEGRGDWQSLDGSALLAVGLLLEETCAEVLGAEGWRAFVEADEDSDIENEEADSSVDEEGEVEESGEGSDAERMGMKRSKSLVSVSSKDADPSDVEKRSPKKRKLNHGEAIIVSESTD